MSKYDYLHALYQALIPLNSEKRNKIMRRIEDRFRSAEEDGLDENSVTNTLGSPQEYAKQFLIEESVEEIKEINPDDISLDSLKSKESIITRPANLIGDLVLATDDILASDSKENEEIEEEIKEDKSEALKPTHYEKAKTEIKKVYTSPQAIPKTQVSNHPVKMILIAFGMLLFNATFVLGPFVVTWSIVIALVASGFALSIGGIAVILSGLLAFPLSFVSVPLVLLSHPTLLFAFGFLLTGIGGLLCMAMIYLIRFFGYLTFKYFGWNLSVIRGY